MNISKKAPLAPLRTPIFKPPKDNHAFSGSIHYQGDSESGSSSSNEDVAESPPLQRRKVDIEARLDIVTQYGAWKSNGSRKRDCPIPN